MMSAQHKQILTTSPSEEYYAHIDNHRGKGHNHDYIAELFSNTVTSTSKQDVAALVQGAKGSGKSHATLRIAYNTARRIAEICDGDPEDWEKYFKLDNVAIIDPERAFNIMSNAKPRNVYIFDDIGVGWGARSFASKSNKAKGDIFQINRVSETVQLFSVPNAFLLDKIPRMLCNYMIEMSSKHFDRGYTAVKMFKAKTIFKLKNKQVTPHLVRDGGKVTRYLVYKPPSFLSEQYDALRANVTKEVIAQKIATINQEDEPLSKYRDEEPRKKSKVQLQQERIEREGPKGNGKDNLRTLRIARVVPIYEQNILLGMTHKEALREIKVPSSTWNVWKREGLLQEYGIN